jgi:hypothetical protein
VPLVGDKGATLIVVLFCFCLIVPTSCIAFASSGNWVEVTTFPNAVGSGMSSHFTIDHVDWRIKWEFNPRNGSEGLSFTVRVIRDGGSEIRWLTTHETTGILNIYNASGTFFLVVQTVNADSGTLIIEQNTDSIPEFPSWTILPLLLAATVLTILYKKRLTRNSPHSY